MSVENSKPLLKRIMTERRLSIVVFSLFFSWVLSFPFEGQVLYTLTERFSIDPHTWVFAAITATFLGLFSGGFLIKTKLAAKRIILFSIVFCMFVSLIFFFKPSILWGPALFLSSFLGGVCVAAWGFYFQSGTPSSERIKTAADGLIYSNVLMILINTAAVLISPYVGLGISMIMLGGAFFFSLQLPSNAQPLSSNQAKTNTNKISINKPLAFLCLFVVIITINSGLMYQVINPAFAHLDWLVSWYWAVPYIVALYIMKNLPRKTNRTYILYVGMAMIGFSFIAFMIFDRSAGSYLVVNTLMLGACGVYDLFWWSILGEMLDFDENPAKILGLGLSANVMGVLLGGLVGNTITSSEVPSYNPSVIALAVVCICLSILPPLHKHLTDLLKNHAYLTVLSGMSQAEQSKSIGSMALMGQLTERESEIAALLLKGKTYKMIANELYLSENTIKTHIKNIYSKFNINSKMELFNLMMGSNHSLPK